MNGGRVRFSTVVVKVGAGPSSSGLLPDECEVFEIYSTNLPILRYVAEANLHSTEAISITHIRTQHRVLNRASVLRDSRHTTPLSSHPKPELLQCILLAGLELGIRRPTSGVDVKFRRRVDDDIPWQVLSSTGDVLHEGMPSLIWPVGGRKGGHAYVCSYSGPFLPWAELRSSCWLRCVVFDEGNSLHVTSERREEIIS